MLERPRAPATPRRHLVCLAALTACIYLISAVEAGAEATLGERQTVSTTGPEGDPAFQAEFPEIAFNPSRNEYLVAWFSDASGDGEAEVYARRLDANGVPLASQQRISDAGPEGDPDYDASFPSVAFNPLTKRYLVSWGGEDDRGSMVEGEGEVFAQLLDEDGREIGTDDRRISVTGPDGDARIDSGFPDVAANSRTGEFLVAWSGDDGGSLSGKEIFIQLLDPDGGEKGADDRKVTRMGQDNDHNPTANSAEVAYDPMHDQYMVVWDGVHVRPDDNIFAQRLNAAGEEVGADDRQISTIGAGGDSAAYGPVLAFNPQRSEYMVAWHGWTGEREFGEDPDSDVYVQRLTWEGAEIGTDDQRISSTGADGDGTYADIAYHSGLNEYLVVFSGDDEPGLGESEIYGQQLTGAGSETGVDDQRLTSFGPDGDSDFSADFSGVAPGGGGSYLIAFEAGTRNGPVLTTADSSNPGKSDDELEIYARRASFPLSSEESPGSETGDPDPTNPAPASPEGDPPSSDPGGDGSAERSDLAAASLKLRRKAKVQRGRLGVRSKVNCPTGCQVVLQGRVKAAKNRYRLRRKSLEGLDGRVVAKLKLTGGKRKQKRRTRKLRRVQRKGKKVRSKVVAIFRAEDGAESRVVARRRIRIGH